MATQIGTVLGVARKVAARLAGDHRVRIVYARYQRGANYTIESRTVLPLDPLLLQRSDVRSQPLHHLSVDRLLARLADEYMLAEITRALMESFASENAARLRVMESADRNIDERLGTMNQRAHTLRQEAITAELLDLITGAAASAPQSHAL
jgi:F-type H+-transporting ATPase subunit gamma